MGPPQILTHETLATLIEPYSYGTNEEDLMEVSDASSLSDEYIEALRNTSI